MLIAGPNLTIDRTMRLGELRPGQVLRVEQVTVTPGGKGLNVARTAVALGSPGELVGFVAGRMGAAAAEMIAEEGVALRSVPCAGETRSTAVLLEDSGRTTVINEPGPPLGPTDWADYERAVDAGLDRDPGALVCSGSSPPGTPAGGYARLVGLARDHGALSLVDASGDLLASSLEARPDVVTPNLGEAEALLDGADGEPFEAGAEARERALRAAAALHERGAATAIVTAADAGVAVVDARGRWWVPALSVEVRNAVGAGDAFVTALALALVEGHPLAEAVQRGVATAAASVESPIAGTVDGVRARMLRAQVAAPEPA